MTDIENIHYLFHCKHYYFTAEIKKAASKLQISKDINNGENTKNGTAMTYIKFLLFLFVLPMLEVEHSSNHNWIISQIKLNKKTKTTQKKTKFVFVT